MTSSFLTSKKDVYAIGDLIFLSSKIDNELNYVPLAGNANKEGRELASYLSNIYEYNNDISLNVVGTSILKLFSINITSVGFNEELLKLKGIEYQKIYLTPNNHVSYYPNHNPLYIKVLFSSKDDYRLLGTTIIAKEGVDKRIDLLKTAIKFDIKGYRLKEAELSYAPPFSSAKDPINMIGYMIENLKNNLIKQVYSESINDLLKEKEKYQFIDVRSKEEFNEGHIEGFINIPLDKIRENINKIDKNKIIILNCLSAIRSYNASRILFQKGFNCYHLAGGYRIYKLYEPYLK